MRFIFAFIMSWLAVTFIYVIASLFDMPSTTSITSIELWGVVCAFAATYFFLSIIPSLYVVHIHKSKTSVTYIKVGLIASLPMLLLSIYSLEVEWIISTLIAGVVGGYIFYILEPVNGYSPNKSFKL